MIPLSQCPVTMVKGVSALKQTELHAFGILPLPICSIISLSVMKIFISAV